MALSEEREEALRLMGGTPEFYEHGGMLVAVFDSYDPALVRELWNTFTFGATPWAIAVPHRCGRDTGFLLSWGGPSGSMAHPQVLPAGGSGPMTSARAVFLPVSRRRIAPLAMLLLEGTVEGARVA